MFLVRCSQVVLTCLDENEVNNINLLILESNCKISHTNSHSSIISMRSVIVLARSSIGIAIGIAS